MKRYRIVQGEGYNGCKHFSDGILKAKFLKIRGDIILDSDGEPDGYVENLKVRDKQIGCSFYEEEK